MRLVSSTPLLEPFQDASRLTKSTLKIPEIEMLALTFCRVRLPVLAIIATVLTWSSCQAVGSFQTTPAFPSAEKNDDPRLPPMILWPDESATAIIGGCGKGRVGDPQTHGCRGPGDIPGDIRSLTR